MRENDTSSPVRDHRGTVFVLLLAGGLQPTPLERSLGTPTLLMWASPDRTILQEWIDATIEVTAEPARVLGRDPSLQSLTDPSVIYVEDSDAYRGTAGVVRDAAGLLSDPSATLIVCEGRRRPSVSLGRLLAAHRSNDAGVTLACSESGEFLGLYVIEAELLDGSVPRVGYQDLKEQWLNKVRGTSEQVRISSFATKGFTNPIHSREDLLKAANLSDGALRRRLSVAEAGRVVVASSALVERSARVKNSIVFGGGRIEKDAVVVRSVIGPSGSVAAGQTVVDTVLA